MEEVIEGLNSMCTVVGDIISSVTWVAGYGGASCCGEKSYDDVRHGSTQSGSWWGVERYSWTAISVRHLRVYSHTIAHGWSSWTKKCTLEFMDLSDTNYKFMDLKMYFHSYRPKWHELQVDGSRNAFFGVRGPKWQTLTSWWTSNVFYSLFY